MPSAVVTIATALVALRKESVDRNRVALWCVIGCIASLSARRAWIEIVGPRAAVEAEQSLSARRAWIEIGAQTSRYGSHCRSLSARRAWIEIVLLLAAHQAVVESLSARRAWIEIISARSSRM